MVAPSSKQPKINLKVNEELINGKRWVVMTWQERNGVGWQWDDMPPQVRNDYLASKEIVEKKMGGIFEYKPLPGEGAVITVKFPAVDIESHIAGLKQDRGENEVKLPRLLVVDDEPGIVDFMQKIYTKKGFWVFTALDGVTGLEIFKKEKPYICIFDVQMPYSKLNGIELLKEVRKLDKHVYCILIGHWTDPKGTAEAAISLEVLDYAHKPFSIERLDEFIDKIQALLAKK